jgi:hypothetical protein
LYALLKLQIVERAAGFHKVPRIICLQDQWLQLGFIWLFLFVIGKVIDRLKYMNEYLKKMFGTALPLSSQKQLPAVLNEWYCTERVRDHDLDDVGQVVEAERPLRFYFEIKNQRTKQCLWVGEDFILKFGIQLIENGQLPTPSRTSSTSRTRKKLAALKNRIRFNACLGTLRGLKARESNDILKAALDYYEKNDYLSPKYAFVVFWQLTSKSIDHCPSFFKISLKKAKYKKDLALMPTESVHLIWPALSSRQRQVAERYGHCAP